MSDFLLGVPGKLKTLVDRLSSTWAAKLDTLHDTRITSARAGYLDKLNLSGKATDDAVWTTTRAGYLDMVASDPTRKSPIAANFPVPSTAASGLTGSLDLTAKTALTRVTNTGATLVDVVSITGAGVLSFVSCGVNTGTYQIQIIIDGVTVVDFTSVDASLKAFVGALSGIDVATAVVSFDPIPFNTSLVIKHRSPGAFTAYTQYKVRRTS